MHFKCTWIQAIKYTLSEYLIKFILHSKHEKPAQYKCVRTGLQQVSQTLYRQYNIENKHVYIQMKAIKQLFRVMLIIMLNVAQNSFQYIHFAGSL